MTFSAQIVAARDDMLFRTAQVRADSGETWFDCTLPAGRALDIRNIAVILFESEGKLLPFAHPLWWASLFNFTVGTHIVYERPIHRFADPIVALALYRELEPEDAWRYIGKLNPDFEYPYRLHSQELARCVLKPRCLSWETVPETAHAMVILDGRGQRIITG
jgi:hypothetical protein